MKHSLRDQTIAFCGTLQAAELVRQVATGGQCSQAAAARSIDSLFASDPDTTEAVYSGLDGVRLGLTIAREIGTGSTPESMHTLRYASGLLRLAKIVRTDAERQQRMGRELELIEPVRRRAESPLDSSVIAQLADVYRGCLSTLPFRIQVSGQPQFLKQVDKVEQIRALLLAGLRSGFLWYQLGGRPWRLLFQRSRMFRTATALLEGHQ